MQEYTYICWIHTDAIIIKTPDDKVAGLNDAHRKAQEDFFIKYFTSHLYLYVSKGLFKVCMWEGAGDRTLLKYFDPEVMAVSVVSFSFSMVAQPSTGFSYYISSTSSTLLACLHWLVEPNWPELNCPLFNSSALYYLQTPTRWYGHASATPSDI